MFDFSSLIQLVGVGLFIVIGFLVFYIINQQERIQELKSNIVKLTATFNDLDEQAKMIVKTDLELNKAQEELDKRLVGLDALQKVSRLISTTLDENEIYQRLNQPILKALGFERYLLFIFGVKEAPRCALNIATPEPQVAPILKTIQDDDALLGSLREGQMVSSFKMSPPARASLAESFGVKHFVLAPILTQKRMLGFIMAASLNDIMSVTEGDEELISILADQIGQSIENARLFEQSYRSSQQLETKVQDRTKELASALENVQIISQNKSDFISAVSHELRTPLTSIKGYASILLTGKMGDLPLQVKERLEKINKHSDNLVKLINDLLDISRIESGRADMKFTKHNLTTIIEGVQDLLTPQLREKHIQCVLEIPPQLPEVTVDVGQIERVLINLLGNAIKFSPEKGVITVKVTAEPDKMTVAVSDKGIGIQLEEIPKLFNEFYRVENEINQNVKGTGLGLALAKKIVEAHKGKIGVTSTPRQGATFYFTLPLARKPESR